MVRIWWIFVDLPSSMISASWAEASLGFSEWRETCKSLYLRRIIQILARTKVLEENKRPKNVRSQGNQTATELKYVLLPIISNKEGREACVRALGYSKQTAKSTYQCHFVLYFVSASVDPSSDIMGSLEHWIDGFVSQDFSCCRFHLKWMRIHGNLFRQFSLKRWLDLALSMFSVTQNLM